MLQYCENKPEIVVDKTLWYLWALRRLGLKHRHKTFDERIEKIFSKLKEILEPFPFNSSLIPS